MEINKIYNEPCLETLKKMPNEFLDCVISSPPYWQLRDYGYNGQWGLEPTFQEYLEHLWQMMDEIHRVLKPTGTCWINLGDTYNNSGWSGNRKDKYNDQPIVASGTKAGRGGQKGFPDKCLILIPHRFAIGCIDRGWIVRNDIIWAKRNGMPEPVNDRFTKKHEYIFLMTKSKKYYFDIDSIRDKVKDISLKRYEYNFTGQEGENSNNFKGNKSYLNNSKYDSIEFESKHRQGMNKERGSNIIEKRPKLPTHIDFVTFLRSRIKLDVLVDSINLSKTKIEHWFRKDEIGFSYPSIEDWNKIKEFIDNWDDEFNIMDEKMTYVEYETDDINKNIDKGKNPGSVSDFWDVNTKPSTSKHYASYNVDLITKPILAGCPEGGLIYDPFMGSGTTAIHAINNNRKFIGSEMSEEYIKICNERVRNELSKLKLF
jgi:site-specific DNA-methyltransferase (adenine-specific)